MSVPPRNGYLEIDPPLEYSLPGEGKTDPDGIGGGAVAFDQRAIDDGRLHYIQSISNQVNVDLDFSHQKILMAFFRKISSQK